LFIDFRVKWFHASSTNNHEFTFLTLSILMFFTILIVALIPLVIGFFLFKFGVLWHDSFKYYVVMMSFSLCSDYKQISPCDCVTQCINTFLYQTLQWWFPTMYYGCKMFGSITKISSSCNMVSSNLNCNCKESNVLNFNALIYFGIQ
jgi:hypothetical protein